MLSDNIKTYQSKTKCPKCGKKSVAKILWGEPIESDQLHSDEMIGKIYVGGCCIEVDENGKQRKHHCNICEYEW